MEILKGLSQKLNGRRGSSVDMAIVNCETMSLKEFLKVSLGSIIYEDNFKTINSLVDMHKTVGCTLRSIGIVPELFDHEVFWKLPNKYCLWLLCGLNFILQEKNETASRFRCLWSDAVHKVHGHGQVLLNQDHQCDDVLVTLLNIFDIFHTNMNRMNTENSKITVETTENSIIFDPTDSVYEGIYTELGKLFSTLAQPGVNTNILYKMFTYISNNTPLRGVFINILSTLLRAPPQSPAIYYLLSGANGIDFKYESYPFNSGMYFATQIYMERSMLKKQYILSIRDTNENGVALYIDNGILCFLYSPPKKSTTTLQLPIQILNKKWYHIAFSITKKRWKDDKFTVYLDGQAVYEGKIVLPQLSTIPSISVGREFYGYISSILFAKEEPPQNVIAEMIDNPPRNDSSPWDICVDVLGHSDDWGKNIVAYFSPALSAGVADTNPREIIEVYSNWTGSISRDCYIWRASRCQETLYICGGSKTLLPLYSIFNNRSSEDRSPCYLVSLVSLLTNYIEHNSIHQQEVYMNRTVSIVSAVLAKAPTFVIEEGGSLEGIMQLFSMATYVPLKQQILDSFLLNYKLWLRCSISLQISVFKRLQMALEEDAASFPISRFTMPNLLTYVHKLDNNDSILSSPQFSELISSILAVIKRLLPFSISKIYAENIVYLSFSISSPILQASLLSFVSLLLYPSDYSLTVDQHEYDFHQVKIPEYAIAEYIYAAIQTLPTSISNLLTPKLLVPTSSSSNNNNNTPLSPSPTSLFISMINSPITTSSPTTIVTPVTQESSNILIPAFISLAVAYLIFVQYIKDKGYIMDHVVELLKNFNETEPGVLLKDIMVNRNISMPIYNVLMNLSFQNGDIQDTYINNIIPRNSDIICMTGITTLFEHVAYSTFMDVQKQFVTDINILISSSESNMNQLVDVNGWDIYLIYMIYRYMKTGDRYMNKYIYKYCYLYMDSYMKEKYDNYMLEKKEEKKKRNETVFHSQSGNDKESTPPTTPRTPTGVKHKYHYESNPFESGNIFASVNGNEGFSSFMDGSEQNHELSISPRDDQVEMDQQHEKIRQTKEDIDKIIDGSIDIITKLIYELIDIDIKRACKYIYRIIISSKLVTGSYSLSYLILYRVLYYIKTKINQDIAIQETQFQVPLRLYDFLYNFLSALPLLVSPSPLYTPPSVKSRGKSDSIPTGDGLTPTTTHTPSTNIFDMVNIKLEGLSLYKYINNELNIKVEDIEEEEKSVKSTVNSINESMNLLDTHEELPDADTPVSHGDKHYPENMCLYRAECTCDSRDYSPVSTGLEGHSHGIPVCSKCHHLHMLYTDYDKGIDIDIQGGILYTNIIHLLGQFYDDVIPKFQKNKDTAMWLVKERDTGCILLLMIRCTLYELDGCDISIPYFPHLLSRLRQQVMILTAGYKRSKKAENAGVYILIELHKMLQRIRYYQYMCIYVSMVSFINSQYFLTQASSITDIVALIVANLVTIPAGAVSWYKSLQSRIESTKNDEFKDTDSLQYHWLYTDEIECSLLSASLTPYLIAYSKDCYLLIRNIFSQLPVVTEEIKKELETKKEIDLYPESTPSTTQDNNEDSRGDDEDEDSESEDSDEEDDIDYIYRGIKHIDNSDFEANLNVKTKEGREGLNIVTDEVTKRYSVFTKFFDDSEYIYLSTYKNILRVYSREGYIYCHEEKPEEETAHWIIDNRQDSLGRTNQYLYNYTYTDHKEAAYKEDMVTTQVSHDHLCMDIDTDINIENNREDDDDSLESKNTYHNLYRYLDGYKATFDEIQILFNYNHIDGRIIITSKDLFFIPADITQCLPIYRQISTIKEILPRRSIGSPIALEIFFLGGQSLFIIFNSKQERGEFFSLLHPLCPSIITPNSLDNAEIYSVMPYTALWRTRRISNFEYLMMLNKYGGRTVQDLTQYYIFPWVLKDYESETINLRSPDVYRDLSKPIGMLNDDRWNEICDRYQSLKEMYDETNKDINNVPPFMYGSHYSTEGVVLYYLSRVEPFTTLNIQLQGGRFDCPERIFYNIRDAFKGCLTSSTDFKELTPEFYYNKDIYINKNNLPLGILRQDDSQTGTAINDVILPPYASSPTEFVKIMRRALESEFVSESLPSWIDLIFGYKQRGQAAEDAGNVYYYLTYEGSVDITTIEDENSRESLIQQILHYGQCPSQLFTTPHEARDRAIPSLSKWYMHGTQCDVKVTTSQEIGIPAIISLTKVDNKIYCIHTNMSLSTARVGYKAGTCSLKMDKSTPIKDAVYSLCSYARTNNKINIEKDRYNLNNSSICIPSTGPFGGKYLYTSLNWDKSIHIVDLGNLNNSFTSIALNYICTCICTDSEGRGIYIGTDKGICIQGYIKDGDRTNLQDFPGINNEFDYMQVGNSGFIVSNVLYGQKERIVDIVVNSDLDIVATAAADGTVCLYSALECNYLRRIKNPRGNAYDKLTLSKQGFITCLSKEENRVDIYNIHGEFISSYTNEYHIVTLQYTNDGLCVMIGTEIGHFICLDNRGNELFTRDFSVYGGITAIMDDKDMFMTYLGTDKGNLIVLFDPLSAEVFKYTL
ncbi:hypothetical protein WA158_001958 [Blastocystis sp. Blastoise]